MIHVGIHREDNPRDLAVHAIRKPPKNKQLGADLPLRTWEAYRLLNGLVHQ